MNILNISTIVLNAVIGLISFYLLFLFIKSKDLHDYPSYNTMIFSLIILIDNAFRLFPANKYSELIQYIQAFTLTFLDKLLLTTMTSQAFILFLGMVKTQFYYKHEKAIFFLTLSSAIVICGVLTTFYILIGGKKNHEDINHYFYCGSNKLKDIADPIFDSIFLFLNIYYFMDLLVYVFKKKKQESNGEIEDSGYGKKFEKFLLMFIANSVTFTVSYLIIFHIIPMQYIDIIYLFICLIMDVVYNINEATIKETRKTFCINGKDSDDIALIELNEDIC
jgi:hypothetical protein